MHDRELARWFEQVRGRQLYRVAKRLHEVEERRLADPGGGYTLTIRGLKPAQIALDETPDELLRKNGEIGRRLNTGFFISGS